MGSSTDATPMPDGGMVTLRRKESSSIPVEADSISPDRFLGLGLSEISALPAFYGRRRVTLGDLFEVDGAGGDNITVSGDLRCVKKIGYGMSRGLVTVTGTVGPHLGAYMSGGQITVQGDVGDWAGAHMKGGRITVEGSAGHFVGAGYSGELRGVLGGTIYVRGNAGREVGARMRRGLIVVLGDVGEFAGGNMIAGSVIVGGRLGARPGAGMKRGSIVALGEAPELLPTFRYACRYQPAFLRFYARRLAEWGLPVDVDLMDGFFRRYVGDMNALGKGEILVHDQPE
ncbi:MAG: formylmethanofuran dehydrogenase subunit C [bacterium]